MPAGTLVKERYEILGTLGAGGEGRVVKALDRQHGRFVALKIRPVLSNRAREELLNEARILLAVPPHPLLPLVREDFFEGQDYVVAMDWVDGTDLATLLRERGRPGLAPSSVLSYLSQAAEALTHLHSQVPAVIHGDVKPGNLILTRGGRVKLVDFGMSSAPNALRRRTGTPGFRAPELAAEGAPSRASDVYALAATAFALLSGFAPEGVLPSWQGIDPVQAGQLEAAIRLGMATDPARRPATPGELIERLRAGWTEALPTGVVTFCLSDIEGSTALWDSEPAAMAEALVRHDELIADCMASHGGRLLQSMGEGDSTVSVFDSAPPAVEAALAAARALAAERWPGGLRIAVRFGIHTGEVERRGTDYVGPTISLAARLRGQADGGQIFLSWVTTELVAGHLPEGCELIDLGPHRLRGFGAPERIHAVKAADISAPLPATDCPYRGLLAFEPEDRDYFFGREEVIEELIARLAPGRLLAVVGASGSGKSSALRAGLIAAVRGGDVPGVERACLLTPGVSPELDVPDDGGGLVVVDQFEEVFTLCPARRQSFIDAVLALHCPVAIGLRADMYDRLGRHTELARAVAANQILLGAMTYAELERAVKEPARLAGLRLEPGLVELALRDVAGEPGALPLLSHALRATWERRDGRTLTVEGYRQSGGVASAIAQTADSVIGSLPADQRQMARNVLLRLTELGDAGAETRRRVTIDELVPEGVSPEAVQALLDRLADARLVTLGEGTAEVAHEALIREWPTLRNWLDEDREGIRLQQQFGHAARLWDAGGRDRSDLFRGARLGAAADWAKLHRDELNATEHSFIDASRRHAARATRRLYGVLVGVGLLLLISLVAVAIALISRGQAVGAQAVAKSRALAAESQTELSVAPELSILLAMQAVRTSATPPAMYALREAVDQSPLRRQLPGRGNQGCAALGYDEASPAIAYTPSGGQIAEVACDGKVLIVDDATGHVHARWDVGAPADAVAFSPDRRTLAVAGAGGITLLNAATGNVLRTLQPQSNKATCGNTIALTACPGSGPGPPYCAAGPVDALGSMPAEVAFSPDGARLAVSYGFNLDIWRLHGSSVPRVVNGVNGCIEGIGFSRSGAEILVADNADVDVIDAASGRLLGAHVLPGNRRAGQLSPVVRRLAVSSNGRYVAASVGLGGGNGGEVELFNAAPWNHLATIAYSADVPIGALAFSPDSSRLAIGAGDGRTGIWSVATGRELLPLSGQTREIASIAWRPDSGEIASASADGEGLVWRSSLSQGTTIATGGRPPLAAANTREDRVWGAFASPGPGSEALRSWTRTGAPVEQFTVAGPQNGFAAGISQDGRFGMLVNASQNLVVRDLANHRTIGTASQGLPVTGLSLAGDRLAVGSSSGDVILYELAPGISPLADGLVPGGPCGGAAYAAISADAQRAAGVGACGGAILWNAQTGRQLETFDVGVQAVSGVSLSPDGRLLAVSSLARTTTLFDLSTKRALHLLTGDTAPVTGVAFSPRRAWLATASEDGDVRIWDPSSGQLMRVLPEGASVTSVAFTPNGQDVVSTDSAGRIHIQDACSLCGNASALLRLAAGRVTRALTRSERQTYGT